MKQIAKTGKVLDRLKASVGPDADIEKLAVFEAVALNQLPLRKKQPLYNGAVASLGMLKGMADKVNAESLPLAIMHGGGFDLPEGRVFHGEVVQGDQGSELRTLIFLSDTAGALVAKLDNGTVDQVSVGVVPQQILCSSCGWDYRSPEATFDNLYEGVCGNDHVIGENGVHAELIGCDSWYELSLVDTGGAQGARIAGPSNAVLASLAASGAGDPHVLCLHASPTPPPEKPVPPKTEGADALLQLTDRLVAASVEVSTLTAERDALKARVAELEAREPEKVEAPEAAVLAAAQASAEAALAELKALATEARTQAGLKAEDLPADPAALAADIKDSRSKVAAIVEASGASRPAAAPAALAPRSNAAFLTPKS